MRRAFRLAVMALLVAAAVAPACAAAAAPPPRHAILQPALDWDSIWNRLAGRWLSSLPHPRPQEGCTRDPNGSCSSSTPGKRPAAARPVPRLVPGGADPYLKGRPHT
jgi:hypothetical protein